jgi:hypothetical protein
VGRRPGLLADDVRCRGQSRPAIQAEVLPLLCRVSDAGRFIGGAAYSAAASESLQGRKPRWRNVGPCRGRYGDLNAAGELADLDRSEAASFATVKRLTNERLEASKLIDCRTICDDWRISGRALPWPVERWRARWSDLHDCNAVMRCRP